MVGIITGGTLQPSQFQLFRSVFEDTGHMRALSDLAIQTVESEDMATLADAANTVAYHVKSLAAIGSLSDLVELLMTRYRTLRTEQPLHRSFILAMTRLLGLFHTHQRNLEILHSDLLICEQQNTAAVCSPASDNMIGMQASSLETDEDIEAVFASGNSMDDQLLQRVFMRVLLRAGKTEYDDGEPTSKMCNWLNQLRIVGSGSFDELVTAYVKSTRTSTHGTTKSMDAITALVAAECVSLPDVLRTIGPSSEVPAIRLVVQLLLKPASALHGLSLAEQYRYSTIQRLCCVQQAQSVAPLLMAACGDPEFDISNEVLHALIIEYTTTLVEVVRKSFHDAHHSRPPTQKAVELSQALVARGIDAANATNLDVHQILAMTTPLSVRFCAGALTYLSKGCASDAGSGGDLAKEVMIEAIQSGNNAWPQLLGTAISDDTKRDLHAWAQDRLLMASGDAELKDDVEAQRYLDVLDLTYHSVRGGDDTAVLVLLNDKLRGVERQLSASSDEDKANLDRNHSVWQELSVLLHICCLHVSADGIDMDANQQARANLLSTLCTLCMHPRILMDVNKAEYLFDLASALSDSLPEQTLQGIARTIKPMEARIQALVGMSSTVMSSDTWLALASQLPSAQSRGTTTAQQRALSKHAAAASSSSSQSTPSPSTTARPGVVGGSTSFGLAQQSQPQPQQRPWPQMGSARGSVVEMKTTPFALRRWEVMPDSTPVMGENDTSLSLGLFGARKV
ncbi:RNA polymerase II mediator complex subunit [Recurvomyces mirabilis]|uniref:RNA polymerase II mediator complex subunit n=1 Tax=Recurvomyces mirabilis TaxID=574656 RepID=A0AAE0WMF6_9PEZI|nr:RNA polymerase II mediator complex subunit [Recurvomyces mirabilis]KAK5154233.1 RNA polymerase II mediator complex subunit [Recurvomyces mirabilis]